MAKLPTLHHHTRKFTWRKFSDSVIHKNNCCPIHNRQARVQYPTNLFLLTKFIKAKQLLTFASTTWNSKATYKHKKMPLLGTINHNHLQIFSLNHTNLYYYSCLFVEIAKHSTREQGQKNVTGINCTPNARLVISQWQDGAWLAHLLLFWPWVK